MCYLDCRAMMSWYSLLHLPESSMVTFRSANLIGTLLSLVSIFLSGLPSATALPANDVIATTSTLLAVLFGAVIAYGVSRHRILSEARADTAELHKRAEADIAASREEAEEEMRNLRADTDVVWEERDRLLEETRAMAKQFEVLAAAAATRLSPTPAQPEVGTAEADPETAKTRG